MATFTEILRHLDNILHRLKEEQHSFNAFCVYLGKTTDAAFE